MITHEKNNLKEGEKGVVVFFKIGLIGVYTWIHMTDMGDKV